MDLPTGKTRHGLVQNPPVNHLAESGPSRAQQESREGSAYVPWPPRWARISANVSSGSR